MQQLELIIHDLGNVISKGYGYGQLDSELWNPGLNYHKEKKKRYYFLSDFYVGSNIKKLADKNAFSCNNKRYSEG